MLAAAFCGMVLLARTGAATRALANDPACAVVPAVDTPPAAGAACSIVVGKIASVKRLSGVPYVGFAADDGRTFEIADRAATAADIGNLSRATNARAALQIVLGTPAILVTASSTYALASRPQTLHYAGVALVAIALSYFAAWIAVSILKRRGRDGRRL